jgi:hypothetical protein
VFVCTSHCLVWLAPQPTWAVAGSANDRTIVIGCMASVHATCNPARSPHLTLAAPPHPGVVVCVSVCVLRPHRIEIVRPSKWLLFVLCISLTSIFFWRLLLLPPQNDMVAIHYSGVPAHQSAVTSFALCTNGTRHGWTRPTKFHDMQCMSLKNESSGSQSSDSTIGKRNF